MNVDLEGLRKTALKSLGQLEDGGGSGELLIAMTHPINKRVEDWEHIDNDRKSPLGEVMMKKLHNADTLMLIYLVCDARAVLEWAESKINRIKETI